MVRDVIFLMIILCPIYEIINCLINGTINTDDHYGFVVCSTFIVFFSEMLIGIAITDVIFKSITSGDDSFQFILAVITILNYIILCKLKDCTTIKKHKKPITITIYIIIIIGIFILFYAGLSSKSNNKHQTYSEEKSDWIREEMDWNIR